MVSVIIPNYNHSKFLVERIESVLGQSYQDFELIILDDASLDNSREVIERYANHPKVSHVVINEQNSGTTFKQWERGFNLAQGEYVWLAESDDFAASTMLEECVRQLDSSPEVVICYCDSNFVDQCGEPIKKFCLEELVEPAVESAVVMDGLEFVRSRLLVHNYIYNASMAVFRKSALAKTSQVYKSFRGCGDWVFWAEVATAGSVARVCKRLNNFRQHPNKVSANMSEGRVDYLESAEALTEILSLYVRLASDKVARQSLFKTEINTIYTIVRLMKKTRRKNHDQQIVEHAESLLQRIKNEHKWYSVRAILRLYTKII